MNLCVAVAGSRIVESMRDARWCEIVCTAMHRCVTARRSPIADRIPLIFERNISSAIPLNPFFYQSEVILRTHETIVGGVMFSTYDVKLHARFVRTGTTMKNLASRFLTSS